MLIARFDLQIIGVESGAKVSVGFPVWMSVFWAVATKKKKLQFYHSSVNAVIDWIWRLTNNSIGLHWAKKLTNNTRLTVYLELQLDSARL